MAIQTPKIIVSDENGSKELSGDELVNFLSQQKKDIEEETNRQLAKEQEYFDKVAIRNQVITRLGLSESEADILIPEIPKPLHLLNH